MSITYLRRMRMAKSDRHDEDTTFGYPIEEVKSSALDPLAEITEGIMDNIEEDVNDLVDGDEDDET
mgnify:CR=1 FL=1